MVSGRESYEGEQQKESMDSLLQSLFNMRMSRESRRGIAAEESLSVPKAQDFLSAPLAHPRGAISPSFHLLKVTGAKAVQAPRLLALDGEPLAHEENIKSDPRRKFEYIRELLKQFQESRRSDD